jgi:metal-dependent amidase/aminoacylase/carboxypeptidase family protein
VVPIWASWDSRTLGIGGPAPATDTPTPFDVARVVARVTTALHDLVDREGQSPEPVSFRVRRLTASSPAGATRARPPSFLGTAKPDKGITEAWHRSGFDIDEDALPVGVHVMATAALGLLR